MNKRMKRRLNQRIKQVWNRFVVVFGFLCFFEFFVFFCATLVILFEITLLKRYNCRVLSSCENVSFISYFKTRFTFYCKRPPISSKLSTQSPSHITTQKWSPTPTHNNPTKCESPPSKKQPHQKIKQTLAKKSSWKHASNRFSTTCF